MITLLAGPLARAQAELAVEVELGQGRSAGTVKVALCPSEDAFHTDKGCRLLQTKAQGTVVRLLAKDLPEGTYAIKAFHDVNDNGELDTNWMGIPKEPYGFSNDAMGAMGPPKFHQASFVVKKGSNQTRLRMRG